MDKVTNFKVDAVHQCIDRSTPEGQMFAEMQKKADPSTPEGKFTSQLLAYTEAAAVIANTLPDDVANTAMDKLRKSMDNSIAKMEAESK